jgi:hypothetical protein
MSSGYPLFAVGDVMKIIYIIPFYKRFDLTELCFSEIKKQGCEVYTVGSEGDDSRLLAEKYGFHYIEHRNHPLGAKNNALSQSLKDVDFDYAILLGSDNFVSDNFTTVISDYLSRFKPLCTTFDSLYFYNQNTKLLTSYKGVTGVGRCFSREVVAGCDWKLWEGDKKNALDSSNERIIQRNGYKFEVLNPLELGVEVLDVKYSQSITRHDIVRAGQKIDKISIDLFKFEQLSNYSSIYSKIKKTKIMSLPKLTIRVTKAKGGLEVGQVLTITRRNAIPLINNGVAELVGEDTEQKPKVKAKASAKGKAKTKKVEPCEDCEETPCEDCEKAAETTNIPDSKKAE